MIARLQGTLALKESSFIILDVHGVGYKVLAPSNVLKSIGAIGQEAQLYIHTHVREDLLELYGFINYKDLVLFEMLLGVSGIGCKTALGIFGNGTSEEIVHAILKADTAFFSGVPRLGTKNAQKIIIELKGKLGDSSGVSFGEMIGEGGEDVVEALKLFGYTPKEAQEAFRNVRGQTDGTQERIRLALKYLGK